MNKDKKIIIGLVVIVIILLVGVFAFITGRNSKEEGKLPVVENNFVPVNKNNALVNYNAKGFSFQYSKSWKTIEQNNTIVIDPKKVFSAVELEKVDMPSGLISFEANQNEINSYVIGYKDFPVVYIGKDGKIEARKFEKYYAQNAPEVSVQGKHIITYFIGENKRVNYYGEYNDAYLNDFNQMIDTLEIK